MNKIIGVGVALCLLSGAGVASATEVVTVAFNTHLEAYEEKRMVIMEVYLDAREEVINAITGSVVVPRGLSFVAADSAESVVGVWIREPAVSEGVLQYEGIMPHGFSGIVSPFWRGTRPGKVFEARFRIEDAADAQLVVEDVRVFRNDGLGTELTPALRATSPFISMQQVPQERASSQVDLYSVLSIVGAGFMMVVLYRVWIRRHGRAV